MQPDSNSLCVPKSVPLVLSSPPLLFLSFHPNQALSKLFARNFFTMDTFIEQLTQLLAAYPQTTVSITYSNQEKKQKGTKVSKPATNKITVKLYEASAGKIVKFLTIKSREFSKVLAFLGPLGLAQAQEGDQFGLASLMANVAPVKPEVAKPEVKEPVVEKKENTPVVESKKKKNKKKKKR